MSIHVTLLLNYWLRIHFCDLRLILNWKSSQILCNIVYKTDNLILTYWYSLNVTWHLNHLIFFNIYQTTYSSPGWNDLDMNRLWVHTLCHILELWRSVQEKLWFQMNPVMSLWQEQSWASYSSRKEGRRAHKESCRGPNSAFCLWPVGDAG